jgi:hypothetical protein
VLAAPFLLWPLGLPTGRLGRSVGDVLVLVVIALNLVPVGLELGRWRGQLVAYLPQLPVEWGALITAVSAWLAIRRDEATRRDVAVLAAVTVTLLLAAASLDLGHAAPHTADCREPETGQLRSTDALRRLALRTTLTGSLMIRLLASCLPPRFVWNHRTSRKSVCSRAFRSGASRDRTGDLLLAKQALSQLSYGPAVA